MEQQCELMEDRYCFGEAAEQQYVENQRTARPAAAAANIRPLQPG